MTTMTSLWCLVTSLIITTTYAYNLEGRLPLFKRGPEGSTFGYSGTLHKLAAGTESLSNTLLVIGAPTADAISGQRNTVKPGGIFSCPMSTYSDDCQRVVMDNKEGSTTAANKTGQWLGVTVKSQGEGKNLVACAHRFHSQTRTGKWVDGEPVDPRGPEYETVCGKCFMLDGTTADLEEVASSSPCDGRGKSATLDRFEYAEAQSGTSLAVIDDEYVAGGPGTWAWSGALFDYVKTGANKYKLHESGKCTRSGRSKELYNSEQCAAIPVRKDSYMGFSVATSKTMLADRNTYITGAPKGHYTGSAHVYWRIDAQEGLQLQDTLYGDVIGSSFGFSVAALDINGDGMDDLVVGAPQYFKYSEKAKHGGAIYAYINNGTGTFSDKTPQIILGVADSFFGYSLTNLGDVDQDGYEDLAVGAPYSENGGKVHILRGSAEGALTESQVLSGVDFQDGSGIEVKGFGVALSSKVDVDSNKYPDLLVGSSSDYVTLLRARPIITMESKFYIASNLLEESIIDLENKDCWLDSQNAYVSCFSVQICFRYEARHAEYSGDLPVHYKMKLDSGVNAESARIWANNTEGVFVIQDSGSDYQCVDTTMIYFNSRVTDKLTPIVIDLEYNLESDSKEVTRELPGDEITDLIEVPILDAKYDSKKSMTVTMKNDCGDDGCQSALTFTATMPDSVIAGTSDLIVLHIEVTNTGEGAHETSVNVQLPDDVYFDKFTTSGSNADKISCSTGGYRNSRIICDVGNPFSGFSVIDISLNVNYLPTDVDKIVVDVSASTTSTNPVIPHVSVSTGVIIEQELSLSGFGRPQQIRFSEKPILGESAIRTLGQIGPELEYIYNVKNTGVRPASHVALEVDFPSFIYNGKWLLYLVSTNVARGVAPAGECRGADENELKKHLDQGESAILFAHRSGAVYSPRTKRDLANAKVEGLTPPRPVHQKTGGSAITLDCSTNVCKKIICTFEDIQPSSSVSVRLVSHVWNATLLEEFKTADVLSISTTAELVATKNNVKIEGDPTITIATTVDHDDFESDLLDVYPWWYIVVAVVALLLIWLIIFAILWRCGFFNRWRDKKPKVEKDGDKKVLVEEGNEEEGAMLDEEDAV